MIKNDLSSLRDAIAGLAQSKNSRRYPAELRARLVGLVDAHPERSVASLASDLDMPAQTLSRIVSDARPAMVPVRIATSPTQNSPIVIRGPGGIVVEGLDVSGLAELIRALS